MELILDSGERRIEEEERTELDTVQREILTSGIRSERRKVQEEKNKHTQREW